MWHEVQTTLSNEFIFGGILDRHPKLKLIDAEYDISWLLYFMFRDDQMPRAVSRHPRPAKISDETERLFEDANLARHDRRSLWDRYHPRVGADCILWGSDFPHVRSVNYDAPRKRSRTSTEICPWPIRRRSWGRTWRRCSGYRSWCEPEGVSLMVQRPLMKHHQMYRVARATREAEAAS